VKQSEWARIVAKINNTYSQGLDRAHADEWFEVLEEYNHLQVWNAFADLRLKDSGHRFELGQLVARVRRNMEREQAARPWSEVTEDPMKTLSQSLAEKAQRSKAFAELHQMVQRRLTKAITQAELEAFTATWKPESPSVLGVATKGMDG